MVKRPNHHTAKLPRKNSAVGMAAARPSVSSANDVSAHVASPMPNGATAGAAVGPPIAVKIPLHADTNGKKAGVAVVASRVCIKSPPASRTNGPLSSSPTLMKSARAKSGGRARATVSATS